MKDFAKSIKIGNAFSKGQVLGESDGKKYVYGGEVNGTYIVHRQPDGKTYSFSSEQEIKDWMRNSKIGNSKVGNSNKAEIIEKKKKEGATLKVDNGQKLEFSDGSTYVKTTGSEDYREAHNYVGNSKVGNGLSDSYEFLMSAGKNDYNSIKEEVKKAGGWTPEIKAKARKTSDTLKKKAKELVETAHKQSAELERLAGDIDSI